MSRVFGTCCLMPLYWRIKGVDGGVEGEVDAGVDGDSNGSADDAEDSDDMRKSSL